MKVLFFDAVAGHPKVAPALMTQVGVTLRPFNQFLRQAVHTARQRQFRYQLPWERVRHQRVLGLNALECWVTVPKPPAGWTITNWPVHQAPPTDQPMMVVNRGVTVTVADWERTGAGLVVVVDDELHEGDQVFWGGVPCVLAAGSAAMSDPGALRDASGRELRILQAEDGTDQTWRLRVEGRVEADAELLLDGRPVRYEVAPDLAGLTRLFDSSGAVWPMSGGLLKVDELPQDRELRGDNDLRYRWYERGGKRGKRGLWIQLLPSTDSSTDEFLDPRAAFCEDEVDEVWTGPRKHQAQVVKVKRVDRDRYQLLVDRLPPEGSLLHLPLNVRNLELQRRALHQLSEAPLPHHQGLLRFCEDPAPRRVRWPRLYADWPEEWFVLTDDSRSGTDQQREFVAKALGGLGRGVEADSGDITILEGPPGSGKTTAICELVIQLMERGLRVLLCGSTHYSIDNVLERLVLGDRPIDALRIGRLARVDPKVQDTQLDARVESLVAEWKRSPAMAHYGDGELERMAARTVIMSADLTCGTTMGIVNHPLFRGKDQDLKAWQRPIATQPWWDVLIVDEASKTTIQEFLVPALMARRWIVVGDVRQLPPFADRADITANLRSLVDDRDREVFPVDHQRARLLLWHLGRRAVQQPGVRFLVAEPPSVLDWLEREMEAEEQEFDAVRVFPKRSSRGHLPRVSVTEVMEGAPSSLLLAGANWVLIPDDLLPKISAHLPCNMVRSRDLDLEETDPWFFRQQRWLRTAPGLRRPVRTRDRRRGDCSTLADLEGHEVEWLSRKDWASEVTWRLTRVHELKRSKRKDERERYLRAIARLAPRAVDVSGAIDEIRDIGLPSILEVLQEGIGEDRSNRPSALTEGLPHRQRPAFDARFTSLGWQHRMHPDISAFPREMFYGPSALQDANTIASRDAPLGWDFAKELRGRRVWLDVRGQEQSGVNQREVDAMEAVLRRFLGWVERKGPPNREMPQEWEVACLAFYTKQEGAIREMLRRVTGDDRYTRFSVPNVEIVSGTVDRFQGREADLVLLSMRNTRRTGFLDSVNRLNVAVTRARQQLVIVGNHPYFSSCRISELEELAKRSPREDARRWVRGGRR